MAVCKGGLAESETRALAIVSCRVSIVLGRGRRDPINLADGR